MSTSEPPKIEFPCPYPIKVLGHAREGFIERVLEIVQVHAPEIDRSQVVVRDSRKGTFVSVHVVIVATGVDQLRNIHTSLMGYDAVRMVI